VMMTGDVTPEAAIKGVDRVSFYLRTTFQI
jgi:hypothetical protein